MSTLKKELPLVSVIMGTFNGGKTIESALKSILSQDMDDFELIICNDASTDNTSEILQKFKSQSEKIKVINHEVNLGLSKSLNDCIYYCRGKYIARMDDDDISYSRRFIRQINFLKNNSEIAFVGSNVDIFQEGTGIYSKRMLPKYPSKKDLIVGKNFVHPSVMFKRETIINNKYKESDGVNRIEDYELWMRLAEQGLRGVNLQENLLKYRENKESFKKRKSKYEVNKIPIILKFGFENGLIITGLNTIILTLLKALIPQSWRNSKDFNSIGDNFGNKKQ